MDTVAPWAASYIGIPFADKGYTRTGCNCFGLLRMVLREQSGVALPEHADRYEDTKDRELLERLFRAGLVVGWETVAERQDGVLRRYQSERPLDCLLLSMCGRACHVGVVVGARSMLHIERGIDATVEKFQPSLKWERRVLGIYRYVRAP